jgi:RHS repeat-associated protein
MSKGIGDPVDVVNGNIIERHVDIRLPGTLEPFEFVRYYVEGGNSTWAQSGSAENSVTGTPRPFGPSLQEDELQWWHNFFSFVTVSTSGSAWTVRTPDGYLHAYGTCTLGSGQQTCAAPLDSAHASDRTRLRKVPSGFMVTQEDGSNLIYDQSTVFALPLPGGSTPSGAARYFLTRVQNAQGATTATVSYAAPTDASNNPLTTCAPRGATGTAPGAGYIRTITLPEGNVLTFYYHELDSYYYGLPPAVHDCLLASISLHDRALSTDTTLVTYDRQVGTDFGLMGKVVLPFRGLDGTGTYSDNDGNGVNGNFVMRTFTSQTGQVLSSHALAFTESELSLSKQTATAPFENISFGLRVPADPADAPETLACSHKTVNEKVLFPATDNATGVGDGSGASAPLTTNYISIDHPGFEGSGRLYRSSQTVPSGSAAADWFAPQSEQNELSCADADAGGPYEPRANKDARGVWQVFTEAPGQLADAGFPELTERTAVREGATTIDGSDALRSNTYTYAYGDNNTQLVSTTSQASALSVGNDATTYSLYDPAVKNHLAGTIRHGWTKDATRGLVERYIGTFYFAHKACSGSSTDDPWHRTLEVHGPCIVSGLAATDCQASGPVTQYTYYDATASGNNANRMSKISRYVDNADVSSCATATHLDTTFESYDGFGNATASTDPNGVQTTFSYSGDLLASSTTAGLTTRYTYDDGKVTSVQHPEGDFEVFCYRDGVSGCTGNWTDRLQWKAKSSSASGSPWSEKVKFTYWPDGTVNVESYLDASGNVRRTVHHAANVLRQPTYSKVGDGTFNAFRDLRQFNAAGDVTAIGFAYNDPPDFCGLPGATPSPLCTATNVDRLGRLASLDQFPAGASPGYRTNISYDAQGNVQHIQPGCSTTGGSCSTPSATYAYDDFGNVTSITAPWLDDGSGASGVTRFSYDALGNVVTKQTAAMAAHGDTLVYAYDALSRVLSLTHQYAIPGQGSETLYSMAYDGGSTPPSGCPAVTNLKGRLSSRVDSFGTTWYAYDSLGRTVEEIRLRSGIATCTVASPNDVPHTSYSYSNNGNIVSIGYPFGRTVTYGYGAAPSNNRISSVSVTTFNGTSWASLPIINSVIWEPYGGLRGYQISHPGSSTVSTIEYMLGDDGTVAPSACPVNPPSATSSDHTGRLRGLWVSSGSQAPGVATGDIYKRTYTWKADQVASTDSCLLGATVPHTESYGYDALLRLTSASRPAGGMMADVGGPFDTRTYGYDGRGNRTSQTTEDCAYNLTYGESGHPDELTQRADACSGSMLKHTYAYDRDGRVVSKAWAQKLDGSAPYSMTFGAGETDSSSNGALDTVLKSATVDGAVYNYFYDAFNRRRLKVYPTGATDEFFHSMSDELLIDRGLSSVISPSSFPIDEYIWLGGRPVAMVRGQLTTGYARLSDTTASCPRNGDAAACGFYFPVTDHIGKPVLMLDSQRKVAGVGEYDPFGHVNRVALDKVSGGNAKETPHPYDAGISTILQLAELDQPIGGAANPSTMVSMRALFHLASIQNYSDSVPTATMSLVNAGIPATVLWSSSASGSNFWSNWVQPASGKALLNFTVSSRTSSGCLQTMLVRGRPSSRLLTPPIGPPDLPPPRPCPTAVGDATGVVPEAYEYRRYQPGATWFWTPLRFPGQYYDSETGLAQNWNRFYDGATGRYLESEPLLQSSSYVIRAAKRGDHFSVHAYAGSNPVAKYDSTGLYVTDSNFEADCPQYEYALAKARRAAGCGKSGSSSCGGNKCQALLKECGVCDICPLLEPGKGPWLFTKSMTDYGESNPLFRYLNVSLADCRDHGDELADTLLHEATHMCGLFGPYSSNSGHDIGDPEKCRSTRIAEECLRGQ